MDINIKKRLKLEEDTSDVTPLQNNDELNRSSNEVVFQTGVNVNNFNKKTLTKKNNYTTTIETEMEETNNNTLSKSQCIKKHLKSLKKELNDEYNDNSAITLNKLNKYLHQIEKSKARERRDSPFLVGSRMYLLGEINQNKKRKKERTDRYGIPINKINRRKIRVTFIDKVSCQPLENVVKVESYKKYNVIKDMPKEDFMVKPRCECCLIY